MYIKTVIGGKEVEGYWNEKIYKSRTDPQKNIRIYINSKEYDIPRDSFHYEELLTEKQQKYAFDLKDKFIEKLEKNIETEPVFKTRKVKQKRQEIIEYFKSKDLRYFLKNKNRLDDILFLFTIDPQLLYILTVDKDKVIDYYNIVLNKENLTKEKINEIIISPITSEIISSRVNTGLPNEIEIYKVDNDYYIEFNNYYLYTKRGKTITSEDFKKILKEKGLKEIDARVLILEKKE